MFSIAEYLAIVESRKGRSDMQITIRGENIEPSDELREHIQRHVLKALGRLGDVITAAQVQLRVLKGRADEKQCTLTVATRWPWTVTVSEQGRDLYAAVSRAADRVGRDCQQHVRMMAMSYGRPVLRARDCS